MTAEQERKRRKAADERNEKRKRKGKKIERKTERTNERKKMSNIVHFHLDTLILVKLRNHGPHSSRVVRFVFGHAENEECPSRRSLINGDKLIDYRVDFKTRRRFVHLQCSPLEIECEQPSQGGAGLICHSARRRTITHDAIFQLVRRVDCLQRSGAV